MLNFSCSFSLGNTDILSALKILAHWSNADPNGLLSNNFDSIMMTNTWAPFLKSFIWEDIIASDCFSFLITTSAKKPLLILSTSTNLVLSVRLISFSCLAHKQDSMIAGCTMISRRQVMMVLSSKNRNRIIGLSVSNCFKNDSAIPAT